MKHKPSITLDVLVVSLLVLCAGLSVAVVALAPKMLLWLALVLLLFTVAVLWFGARWSHFIAKWVGGGKWEGSKLKAGMERLPIPVVLLSGKTITWYNEAFRAELLQGREAMLQGMAQVVPGFEPRISARADGQHLRAAGRAWHVHCAVAPGGAEEISLVYFHDETNLRAIAAEYKASRPGCILIAIDGYDDVFGDMLDSERARVLEGVNRILETAMDETTGLLRRFSSGRYLAVVEERNLAQFAESRYEILDKIRALDESLNLSVSIGVARGFHTLKESQENAVQALDMAQGRGGDQAAEKTPDGFTFYGGVSHGVEKRSKVKSRIVATALIDLMKQADSVVIMGHRLTDLDAIGAAEGVLRICKICDVPAVIAVRHGATLAASLLDAFAAAGCGDDFIEPEEALRVVTKKTLCVVVDTYLYHLVECPEILEKCGSVAVIDHHRKAVGHIQNPTLVCHEPYASSASELVCELLQYAGGKNDKPTRLEAEGMLAGIMLDTRNFSLHTGVRTFEAAAALRRFGAETETTKALFNVSEEEYADKCSLVEAAQIYKGCAITVCPDPGRSLGVAVPQAANDLLTIDHIEASFVAVQSGSSVSISARSMGSVNVQVILEALGGGGHQTMAGAQMKDTTPEDAYKKICAAIDLYRAAQTEKKV